jgi:hypothetical protein
MILYIALWLCLGFLNLDGSARIGACLALAGLAVGLRLMDRPERRAPQDKAVPRPAKARRAGAALIVGAWLGRSALAGVVAYTVAIRFHEPPGFDTRVAVAVGVGRILQAVLEGGRRVAGFPREVEAGHPAVGGVRWLVNSVLAMVLAGYAAVIPGLLSDPGRVVEALTSSRWWPSIPGYHALAEAAGTWLAVTVTVIALLLLLAVAIVLVGLIQRGLAKLIGPDNPLSESLRKDALFWFERTDTTVRLLLRMPIQIDHYDSEYGRWTYVSIFGFTWKAESSFPMQDRISGPRLRRKYGERRRALAAQPARAEELRQQVIDELTAVAPDGWRMLRLEYRAIVGHEETEVTVDGDPRGSQDASDASDDEETTGTVLPLPGFAATGALRELREAGYEPGFGAPFVLSLTLQQQEPETSPGSARITLVPTLREGDRSTEPAWVHKPTRRQYRMELERFPIDRKVRPFWLRNRLHRLL